MSKHRRHRETSQLGTRGLPLFEHERVFPVRARRDLSSALDFNARMATAMAEAIEEATGRLDEITGQKIDRYELARRMSLTLGKEVKKSMIDAYTAQSRDTHTISLVRFVAFVRATGATWLWDIVLQDEGLTVVQGEEAQLAQAALAEKMAAHYMGEAKRLKAATPLHVGPRARR